MNDIIRMAREALVIPFFLKETNDEAMIRLRDFADLVAAAEREACAKVCDAFESDTDADAGAVLAAAIRARGQA
jgi:hypothetical protein